MTIFRVNTFNVFIIEFPLALSWFKLWHDGVTIIILRRVHIQPKFGGENVIKMAVLSNLGLLRLVSFLDVLDLARLSRVGVSLGGVGRLRIAGKKWKKWKKEDRLSKCDQKGVELQTWELSVI